MAPAAENNQWEAVAWASKRLRFVGALSCIFISLAISANAQNSAADSATAFQMPKPQGNQYSSISGTVRDSAGVVLAGVPVRLAGPANVGDRVATTDSGGGFTFPDLAAGTYQLKVEIAGFQPVTSAPLVIGLGERRELPVVAMRIATKTTTVNVEATPEEVATAQVKEEEKQRILGLLPNYYTSYIWDAAPMTRKSKFGMAFRTVTDPVSFLVAAGVAGAEQYHKTFPGYGLGAEGYAKRLGSTYADTVASRMLGSAILPVLFHQDPRYFYLGRGSVRSRLTYALLSSVVCRGDNGRLQPSYSHIVASFAAAGISNLYKAPQDRQVNLTLRNGLIITAAAAGVNVMREFVFRKMTPNVPAFANGKH